ncbi:unnamed protein product [Mytilus edulis]|uniref:Uncharacterized protein n=1 Tax=Mytilus edulis TaxID=6550 RepID=A0A8S3VJL6_MYTED|nr:unnamed protein product [Mytilus edulis]
MTTELETNIVAVERVKEYTETPTEEKSVRMTTELETNIVAVERVKNTQNTEVNRSSHCRESEAEYRNPHRGNNIFSRYIPTQGVVSENDKQQIETNSCRNEGIHRNSYRGEVSENDNRVRDKHCSCRERKEYTETPTEVNSSYFIYIPTQGVVSENDNRVRDKHCSCRERGRIHRNSYRGVVSENDNRVRDNIVAVERVKEYTETPTEVNSSYFIYIPTQGVVSENDNRVRETNIVAVERVKEYTETPTEVNSFILYISLYSRSSQSSQRMTTELETNIVAVERVKEYTETPTEVNRVVSENDNRVRDKHCSCRESEGIHRNSYRGVSVRMTRVRDKHCSCRESEGIHRNSYRGILPRRVRMTELENIVAVERVKEYTETLQR